MIFPSARNNIYDIANIKTIHSETSVIESKILEARLNGTNAITVIDTPITDSNINTSSITPEQTVIGSITFPDTNVSSVVLPGKTLGFNNYSILFYISVIGTSTFSSLSDAVITTGGTITVNGYNVTFNAGETLADVINTFNNAIQNTGVGAKYLFDGVNYKLELYQDNTNISPSMVLSNFTNGGIDSDIGISDGTYVITLQDVVNIIGSDAAISGTGPYSLQLSNNLGINIYSGTSLIDFGFVTTTDISNDTLKLPSHGLSTGDIISFQSSGMLPTPLNAFPNSLYYAVVVDSNTIRVATTESNALSSNYIDISDNGSGTLSVKKTLTSEIYYQVHVGYVDNIPFERHMNGVIDHFKSLGYIIYLNTNPNTGKTLQWNVSW